MFADADMTYSQHFARSALAASAAASAAFAATPVLAAEDEQADGLQFEAAYTVDLLAGDGASGIDYVDNLDLTAEARIGDTRLFVYGLYNNGRDFSGRRYPRGYVASNIETGVKAVRLYEAWVDQSLAGGRLSVRAGLYDLNSEFDALDASGLFLNPAHGIGTDISQSGVSGPSIFPVTSLALRVSYDLGARTTLRMAVLDGVPGDPAHPKRTAIRLGQGDGALLIAEAERRSGGWRVIGGYWRYSAPFDGFGLPGPAKGSQGAYLRGEGLVGGTADGRGTDAFFRLGWADPRFHETNLFASAGLRWRGPLAARADDEAGLALTWTASSPRARTTLAAAGETLSRAEWSFEATYALALTEWLTLQPDVQYFVHPAYEAGRTAWMGGLRVVVARGF